ncbi:MAG: hybrid sensor histidine kinase/response regulator [Prevotella sp.]|nr:hybrid sensor histidine kinase/response regulator [Prevotella sp.]
MSKFGTSKKIITGYILLAVVIAIATWQVYDNSRLFVALNNASEQLLKRRDVVDSLVCSLLETNNAERSVLLGEGSEWPHFNRSVATSEQKAKQLKPFIADQGQRQRIDTLVELIHMKRENTKRVAQLMAFDNRDAFYRDKVQALQSGRDSVVIHSKLYGQHGQREKVYEIIKSKRGFFRRLGDAFRRQHADTVGVTNILHDTKADSTAQRINIADSVANILTDIQNEEQKQNSRQQENVAARLNRLQRVSLQLSQRTGLLLEHIQREEKNALQKALGHAMQSRHKMVVRIAIIGLVAILIAALLVAYILRDIKRERRDRQRIVEAKTETERIMAQRERLLLTITHDIKAPAASIAGFIELLSEQVSRPKPLAYIDSMRHSAIHLQQLVAALLDYHLLESGKAERHDVSFVPQQLAKNCVEEFKPMAAEKGLDITLGTLTPNCGDLWRSDAFRVKQIMSNLIGNAVKYTDRGGVKVEIRISPRQHLIIYVSDTGRGMSQADCQRIFDAFTRLPNGQGKEGVGLGLSITREVVQMLGGTITVTSEEGKGSCFTVSLPIKKEEKKQKKDVEENVASVETNRSSTEAKKAITENNDATNGANDATNGNNDATTEINILAVDDDALQLELFKEMAQKIGGAKLNINTTTSASEAIKLAEETKPQIMFTDIEMPEMSGKDMLKHVKNSDMSTVAMTAHDPSIMTSLKKAGFSTCLFKPFNAATLAATLAQITRLPLSVKAAEQKASFFAPLTAFAEGDTEAEREILTQVGESIKEYRQMLEQGLKHNGEELQRDSISRAAHKAMPLLTMLKPGQCGWLQAITPEHIKDSSAENSTALAMRLEKELEEISKKLREEGIENA